MQNIFESLGSLFHNIFSNPTPAVLLPVAIIVFMLFFISYYIKILKPERGSSEWINMELEKTPLTFLSNRHPLELKDIAPLVIIAFLFFSFAIFGLGDTVAVDVLEEINNPRDDRTHFNGMYFDEIYFVRTAVEHIESIKPFELTHPPLGKEIIAASILTFGMSPFGWRLIGAVCGVLMLVIMYIFVKNMFGKTIVAACATLLFGFDFMRYVQTRIGTIDTFVVFFILLSFFFMYRYITTDRDAGFREGLAPLALSGIFFGLAFSVKWTGFYAGAGLLIIYVIRLVQLGLYYRATEKTGFSGYLSKTLLYSVIFFVIVPAGIYYLAYIPYGIAAGMAIRSGMLLDAQFLQIVLDNQSYMFDYHSRLVLSAEHPFSSVWWQWLFNIRPILYVNTVAGDVRATFGAYGNPVVWWGGLVAMAVMAVRVFSHRDAKALFILIGYLMQLLPWLAVSRILFVYHYFPSTLFLILALAHIFDTMIMRKKSGRMFYVYGFTALAGIIFVIFFPSLSGMFMTNWYYDNYIKWFATWPF